MRAIIFLVLLALLGACRSHKDVRREAAVLTDSVAVSARVRTIASVDSLVSNVEFTFDTLRISVRRPVKGSDLAEVICMEAVRGRLSDRRGHVASCQESSWAVDSVSCVLTAAEASHAESTASGGFSLPAGASAAILAIVVSAVALIIFRARRMGRR